MLRMYIKILAAFGIIITTAIVSLELGFIVSLLMLLVVFVKYEVKHEKEIEELHEIERKQKVRKFRGI